MHTYTAKFNGELDYRAFHIGAHDHKSFSRHHDKHDSKLSEHHRGKHDHFDSDSGHHCQIPRSRT